MSVTLVEPLRAYYEASNAHNADAVIARFAPDATVRDEGKDMHGSAAIRTWYEGTTTKYNVATVPISVENVGDRIIVTTEVSGSFDGSPVSLRFQFELVDTQIQTLEIAP